jgi:hypothetical protein
VSPVEFCCDTGTSSARTSIADRSLCDHVCRLSLHQYARLPEREKQQHPCGFESLLLAGSQIWFVAVEGGENKWQKMVVFAGDWM